MKLGRRNARVLAKTLAEIASDTHAPEGVQAEVATLARAVGRRMRRRAARAVAWALLDAAAVPELPADKRRAARYWARWLRDEAA